jgi:hypothetical protein
MQSSLQLHKNSMPGEQSKVRETFDWANQTNQPNLDNAMLSRIVCSSIPFEGK